MNIGLNIRRLREMNKKTIGDVSEILGVAKITYNHYETQEKIIPIERLNVLCNYYNVSIDYAFGFSNDIRYKFTRENFDKSISAMRIKEFRKENNLTLVKLASLLGTVHPTIVNYENAKNLIPTSFLYDICKKYRISADYLLGRVDEPKYLDKKNVSN